ncbi:MAG: hypothetical protein H6742_20595 [Alphaproteobacteria bacterium]|nr:hypothetical protein [Alphaproteobacteria bacterium]
MALPRLSPGLQRALALLLGLSVVVGLELTVRALGLEDEERWSPPALVLAGADPSAPAVLGITTATHFEPAPDGGLATAPSLHNRARALRVEPRVPGGPQRIVVGGGSAATGQAPLSGLQVTRDWRPPPPDEVVELAPGISVWRADLSISGLLAERTGAEVIDAGAIARDSDGLVTLSSELDALEADVLAIYAGNNESLFISRVLDGSSIPVLHGRSLLRRSHLYRLLADKVGRYRQDRQRQLLSSREHSRDDFEAFAPAAVVSAQWTQAGRPLVEGNEPTDDVQHAILTRFEANLRAIAAHADAAGATLLYINTPPRLDEAPFRAAHGPGVSSDDATRSEALCAQAAAARLAGDPLAAVDAAGQAIALDPAWAHAWFQRGMAAAELGRSNDAVDDLLHALALDISRKRATPALAEVARRVCADTGCRTVDGHAALVARARRDGPLAVYPAFHGDFEHLWPDANRAIADAFAALLDDDPAGATRALQDAPLTAPRRSAP